MLAEILFSVQFVWADTPTPKVATPNVIEQAQALALKKNRKGAALLLNNAIAASSANAKARTKYVETLNHLSRVFFTDKGQRLFEAGQSAMYDTPEVALGQLRDALALEDDNVAILDTITRLQLAKLDCSGALNTIGKSRLLNPQSGGAALLELRALVCLKNFEAFREKVKELPPLDKMESPFVSYFEAQDLMQQNMWHKASEVLAGVNEVEPRFPEAYYWLSRATIELGGNGDGYAQKYVNLCKGLGPRERKLYAAEPRLCVNAKEVEDELAKKNNDT